MHVVAVVVVMATTMIIMMMDAMSNTFAKGKGRGNPNRGGILCLSLTCESSIFLLSSRRRTVMMKRYKVKDIIKMLSREGWYLSKQRGSHRWFRHPTKKGKVTANRKPNETLGQEILNSIFKQEGWK